MNIESIKIELTAKSQKNITIVVKPPNSLHTLTRPTTSLTDQAFKMYRLKKPRTARPASFFIERKQSNFGN